jgi:sterol desaturase/sphingolipid hydroxylase (fatty acid hydroxylase superfamily)
MNYIFEFLLWTFCLYWLHRLAHVVPVFKHIHKDHHRCITRGTHLGRWHYNNLWLFSDTWLSTLDVWVNEVLPTVIIAYLLNAWWLCVLYYLWAALLQEPLEHNKKLNLYPFTAGKWHLVHHSHPRYNFGLFFPIWDIIFNTRRNPK